MSKEIRAYIDENCPDALIIGTGEQHDSALVGTAKLIREDEWVEVAMYSYDALVESFTEQFRGDDSEDPQQDAVEWIDYNVVNAYVGKYTPFIVYN